MKRPSTGTPSEGFYVDVRTYFQPIDWVSPLKCHDFWEMLLVLDGTMGVQTGNKKESAPAGKIYIRAPGVMHSEWCLSPEGVRIQVLVWKYPPRAKVEKLPTEMFDASGLVAHGLSWLERLHPRLPPRHELLDKMLDLVLHECRHPETETRRESRFAKLFTYIEQNLAQPLDVNSLAKVACLSRGHFIEEFHRETGFSPMAYVRKTRLEHAARAVMGSDVVLREIARKFGFRDEFEFSRVFRRIMGVSPGSLRSHDGPGASS